MADAPGQAHQPQKSVPGSFSSGVNGSALDLGGIKGMAGAVCVQFTNDLAGREPIEITLGEGRGPAAGDCVSRTCN